MKLNTTLILVSLLLITSLSLVSSQPPVTTTQNFPLGYQIVETHFQTLKMGENVTYAFYLYNQSTGLRIDNTTAECHFYLADSQGEILIYQNEVYNPEGYWYSNISGEFLSEAGWYYYGVDCQNGYGGALSGVWEVTPSGRAVEDVGTISVGILYLYIAISLGLLFLGYLFLNNKSVFISYTGLFLMILGFTFLYYDLHLSNLYAQTIAFNSGAENTSSGIFIMIAKFLKLAPYIIAGVIAFASVKLLRKAIKGRKSHDGWDDDDY